MVLYNDGMISAENIRNFCTISHVDHGKTTISDHLIATGGLLPGTMAGKLRALDYLESEQQRGITIEASLATFTFKNEEKKILVNLIDTPGHVDFSGKVTDAIRLVDNGLIIVDSVEGVMAQTITVLNQAIKGNLKLVLFINKIDRLIKELKLSTTEIRNRIERIIGEIYNICLENEYDQKSPIFKDNTVLIGSATDGWAINQEISENFGGIKKIIEIYNSGQSIPKEIRLANVLKQTILKFFVSPNIAQESDFLGKEYHFLKKYFEIDLKTCEPTRAPIILTGKLFKSTRNNTIFSIVRILSGQIKQNDTLFSLKLQKWVEIKQIVNFRGKREIKKTIAYAGEIVGIEISNKTTTGDIICKMEILEKPLISDKLYQIAVSTIVEPVNLKDLDGLKSELMDISDIYPDLTFEESKHTGELILTGLGKLQLELIIEDIENKGYEIYTTPPEIIIYMRPFDKTIFTENTSYEIRVLKNNNSIDGANILYEDKNDNLIAIFGQLNLDNKAIVDGFKNLILYKLPDNRKIREFRMEIHKTGINEKLSYEETMILFSKLSRMAAKEIVFETVYPWYKMKITCPESFLGKISIEIERYKGKIEKIITKKISEIHATIKVEDLANFTETIRRVSDGNVFWSIVEKIFDKY